MLLDRGDDGLSQRLGVLLLDYRLQVGEVVVSYNDATTLCRNCWTVEPRNEANAL